MNHIYRTIWSKATNTFVAVPENTAACGKASSSSKSVGKSSSSSKSAASSSQKNISRFITVVLLTLSGNQAFAVDASSGVLLNGVNTVNAAGVGAPLVVNAGGTGYFVQSGSLSINNAVLQNFSTAGGAGSGGGAGLGGALFVNSGASATLNNVSFIGNTATGGAGGVAVNPLNFSALNGGSLNNLFNTGVPPNVLNGTPGANAVTPSASLSGTGNGATGLSGGNGAANVSGLGGAGGAGGNGSAGLNQNNSLMTTASITSTALVVANLAVGTAGAAATVAAANLAAATAAAPSAIGAPATAAALVSVATQQVALTNAAVNSAMANAVVADLAAAAATAAVVAWDMALSNGQLGIGGTGGLGGMGGSGSFGSGGGVGGNGGAGGAGGANWAGSIYSGGANGGTGGAGGIGGTGGFGAGGGIGGLGGAGGAPGVAIRSSGQTGLGGAGGAAGFGGGVGSNNSGYNTTVGGGGGGSGFGGAIFVNDGGTLTLTGNSTFGQNNAVGGLSQNGGIAGQAVGTDLFMMANSTVVLNPGTGNTITFNGTIADNSTTSIGASGVTAGSGANLAINSGLVIMNNNNTYTGRTILNGGTLQTNDGLGLNLNSNLNFAGTDTGVAATLDTGGVFQTNSGLFNRFVGAASNRVQWTGSGGFAAVGKDLTVSLSGNAPLAWGVGGFVANGNALVFGSSSATNAVTFTNDMNLSGGSGSILVAANAANTDTATISGVISNGSLIVGDATHTGMLYLTGANTYAGGTTVNGGTLALSGAGTLNVNGSVTANAGVLDLSNPGAKAIGTLSGVAGTIALGGNTLTVNQAANGTFSGVLKDGGLFGGTGAGLIKAGVGNLTLAGANTYTGATQANAGTLTLTGSLASNVVGVAAGATLTDTAGGLAATTQLTNNGTVTLGAADAITSLVNTGTLNGTGMTLTASATAALNSGSVVNANLVTGVMTNNGAVALNGNNNAVTTNIDSGTTTLSPTGRLVNFATNVNNASTLTLAGGSVATQSATFSAGSTLNLGVNSSFSAVPGTFGTGNIVLGTGANVFLTPGAGFNYTTLTGGSVNSFGGTLNSANFINPLGSMVGGFLGFTGNFVNNGILAPGNSPGVTQIAGNYTENGTLQMQVQNTTPISGYDQVRVGGTVTLSPNSKLIVQTWGNQLPVAGNVYQFISNSTGGAVRVNGTFGQVLFDNSGQQMPVNPVQNAAVVFDVNTGRILATGLNASNSTFADLGKTTSQRNLVSALMGAAMSKVGSNQIDSGTTVGSTAYTLLQGGSIAAASSAARLVPEQYGGLANYGLLSSMVVSDFLFMRSAPLGKSSGLSSGDGVDNGAIYAGYITNKDRSAVDQVARNDFYVGLEGGNSKLTVGALLMDSTGGVSSTYGGGNVKGQGATLYTKFALSPTLSILGSIGTSAQNFNLTRSPISGVASATTAAHGKNASVGATYLAYANDALSILSRLGLNYADTAVAGFQEVGSAQRLAVGGYNASRFDMQAGVLFARNMQLAGRGMKLGLDVGVNTRLSDRKGDMNAMMVVDPQVKFPISFATDRATTVNLGLSANYELSKETSMYVKYDNRGYGSSTRLEVKTTF